MEFINRLVLKMETVFPFSVQFRYSAPPLADLPTTIDQLSPNFYWSVLGNEQAHLQLSWTTFSQLSAWVEDLSTLRILGYTGTAWEDIPAQLASRCPFQQQPNFPKRRKHRYSRCNRFHPLLCSPWEPSLAVIPPLCTKDSPQWRWG